MSHKPERATRIGDRGWGEGCQQKFGSWNENES